MGRTNCFSCKCIVLERHRVVRQFYSTRNQIILTWLHRELFSPPSASPPTWRNDVTDYSSGRKGLLLSGEIRALRNCRVRRFSCCASLNSKLSKHNIGCFFPVGCKNKSDSQNSPATSLRPLSAQSWSTTVNISRSARIASSDFPLLAGAPLARPPLAMTNLLHKHSEPITINPTPGNTAQPQACKKHPSASQEKVSAQQIFTFFLLRAAGH